MVKKVGKYEIGKTLGEGTFGKVKYAVNTETKESVAIKVLDKEKIQKQNMGSQIKKEISIMKMVAHPNIVSLKEVLASRTKIFIVLDLITGGELFDKIVSEGRLVDEQTKFYLYQLVDGVLYCHNKGECHRDLKPENLLLDANGDLKISDFGLSALYSGGGDDAAAGGPEGSLLHTTCGTPNYVAPEVLEDKGYDGRAADIWSIGVILYVLLAGFLPFDEPTMSALFRKIQKAEYSYPAWFTEEAKSLLDTILVPDPAERASLQSILDHPWWGDFHTSGKGNKAAHLLGKSTDELAAAKAAEAGASEAEAGADADGAAKEPDTPKEAFRDIGDQGDDVDEEEEREAQDEGPKSANAFDIINMCGGIALNRMFSSKEERKFKKQHQVISTRSPQGTIEAFLDKFKAMCAASEGKLTVQEVTNFEKSHKAKITMVTSRGVAALTIQTYLMAKDINLLEIRKGRGDHFA